MIQGIQSLFAELGEAACFALCIVELGKPACDEGEALRFILRGIASKYIKYDWGNRANPDNCFVQDRDSFMGLVQNEKGWKSSVEGKDYSANPGELVVEHWLWVEKVKNGSVAHEHFRLKGWDPIANSPTVMNGKIDGYRVFRKVA
jgi:hypothetical protein